MTIPPEAFLPKGHAWPIPSPAAKRSPSTAVDADVASRRTTSSFHFPFPFPLTIVSRPIMKESTGQPSCSCLVNTELGALPSSPPGVDVTVAFGVYLP